MTNDINGTEKTYTTGCPWRVTLLTQHQINLEKLKGVVLPAAYIKM